MVSQFDLLGFFLASGQTTSYTPSFPGGIVAVIVCNANKRKQIGGWLLFYYWGLYSGIFLTALFFLAAFQSYVPETFDDPRKYHLLLLSIVPVFVVLAAQLVIGTISLSVRRWDVIRLLRLIQIAGIVAAALSIAIDIKNFPDGLTFDCLDIFSFSVWALYFSKSKRVRHVFRDHDWSQTVDIWYPPKPAAALSD